MKNKFALIALSLLPFFASACSCIWIESFCEAINPQSDVSTVRIIEKFNSPDSTSTYLLVESIESLIGSAPKDTMTILAGFGTSCDPNYYSLESGDSLVINLEIPSFTAGTIPYDFGLGYLCSRLFLKIENGQIHDGISYSFGQMIDYSDFKTNIVDCSKLSILDNPDILDNVLSIYPNPAKDLLKIGLAFRISFDYQIYDVHGRLISKEKMTDINREIDLLNFQKGIYFIKITINESSVVRKFVKV